MCKFCARDFSLDDASMVRQTSGSYGDQIETLIENHQCYTMQETANILKISESSFEKYLPHLTYVHSFDIQITHKLSGEKKFLDCISTFDYLLKHQEKIPLLKQIVTDD